MTEAERKPFDGLRYGRYGTPTSFALEKPWSRWKVAIAPSPRRRARRHYRDPDSLVAGRGSYPDGRHGLFSDPPFLPAATQALRHRDHLLRSLLGADIASLMRPETRVVFVESPGSTDVRNAGHPGNRQGRARRRAIV